MDKLSSNSEILKMKPYNSSEWVFSIMESYTAPLLLVSLEMVGATYIAICKMGGQQHQMRAAAVTRNCFIQEVVLKM
jgi:hypothetical protein